MCLKCMDQFSEEELVMTPIYSEFYLEPHLLFITHFSHKFSRVLIKLYLVESMSVLMVPNTVVRDLSIWNNFCRQDRTKSQNKWILKLVKWLCICMKDWNEFRSYCVSFCCMFKNDLKVCSWIEAYDDFRSSQPTKNKDQVWMLNWMIWQSNRLKQV